MGTKFEGVDILDFLGQVVELHTQHYKEDFDVDKELIQKVALSGEPEERRLLWMSRPCGTYCLSEREVYLQESNENKVWMFYHEQTNDPILAEREQINEHIQKYMAASGYTLSLKSKQYHALDSFVYEYVNAGGMKDNLKIEINYMLRCHVLPVSRRPVYLPWNDQELTVLNVDPLEIFSAKTVALLNRAAPRDLYDMFNMQKYGLFDETQEPLFRKCIMFYAAIASETVPEYFDLNGIGSISARKIRTDLTPVLRRGERFDLACAQKQVKDYLAAILKPEDTELSFWQAFAEGNYQPGLLFDDADILSRVEHHPMALWKCGGRMPK